MVRTILAVLAGLLLAVASMLLLEYLGMSLFPLPPGIDLDDEADLARLVELSSTGKKLWVILGWAVATFLGSWLAAKLSPRRRLAAALVVAALIVCGVILNVAMIPHPAWMTVLGVLLPLPVAWYAARLASSRTETPSR